MATPDIATVFADVHWSKQQWKANLSDCPQWLVPARVIKGRKGKRAATWNPFELAKLLMKRGINPNKIDRQFRTKPELEPWKDEWDAHAYSITSVFD